MTPWLTGRLCDPKTKDSLTLFDAVYDEHGDVVSGHLAHPNGPTFPIVNGIPRFVDSNLQATVKSFGDEWNYFNFVQFKVNWLKHTVASTLGSTEAFRDKVIVDCGGGSGAQTLWMLESGAKHVVMLELSHSVDDVVQRNLRPSGFRNFDVIQCSIDAPPLRARSIDGIVICHNVIQHTPSVENTARALYELVGDGGEFVFNCYGVNDITPLRWLRHHVVHRSIRELLRRMPFSVILSYARTMAAFRLVPGIGELLEKAAFCVQGDVPRIEGESTRSRLVRRYNATTLNTFDAYGSHQYQHYKSESELRALVSSLQPDPGRVANVDRYFSRPPPIGCALRVRR